MSRNCIVFENDTSWHDLVSAWNHAEDMVAASHLTTNVCITYHETFGCNASKG